MATYTTKRLTDHLLLEDAEIEFFAKGAGILKRQYEENADVGNFPLQGAIDMGVTFMCYRDGVPCGFLIATLVPYMFDPERTILRQETFYAQPGTRAAWFLFNEFVDFGKRNANYVITMIARHTNLTPRTLKRLGFKELETLYRMEV